MIGKIINRVLTPAETNYSVTHQEALAVVYGVSNCGDTNQRVPNYCTYRLCSSG